MSRVETEAFPEYNQALANSEPADLLTEGITEGSRDRITKEPIRTFAIFTLAAKLHKEPPPSVIEFLTSILAYLEFDKEMRASIGTLLRSMIKGSSTPSLGLELLRKCRVRYKLFPMLSEYPIEHRESQWATMVKMVDNSVKYLELKPELSDDVVDTLIFTALIEPLWKFEYSFISQLLKAKTKISNFLIAVQESSGLTFMDEDLLRDSILFVRVFSEIERKANAGNRGISVGDCVSPHESVDRQTPLSPQNYELISKALLPVKPIADHLENIFELGVSKGRRAQGSSLGESE